MDTLPQEVLQLILEFSPLATSPWRLLKPEWQTRKEMALAVARDPDNKKLLLILRLHPWYRKILTRRNMLCIAVGSDSVRSLNRLQKPLSVEEAFNYCPILNTAIKNDAVNCFMYLYPQSPDSINYHTFQHIIAARSYKILRACRNYIIENHPGKMAHFTEDIIRGLPTLYMKDDVDAMITLAEIGNIDLTTQYTNMIYYNGVLCYLKVFPRGNPEHVVSNRHLKLMCKNGCTAMIILLGIPITYVMLTSLITSASTIELDYLWIVHSELFHKGLWKHAYSVSGLQWLTKKYDVRTCKRDFIRICRYNENYKILRQTLKYLLGKYKFAITRKDIKFLVSRGAYLGLQELQRCGYNMIIEDDDIQKASSIRSRYFNRSH